MNSMDYTKPETASTDVGDTVPQCCNEDKLEASLVQCCECTKVCHAECTVTEDGMKVKDERASENQQEQCVGLVRKEKIEPSLADLHALLSQLVVQQSSVPQQLQDLNKRQDEITVQSQDLHTQQKQMKSYCSVRKK